MRHRQIARAAQILMRQGHSNNGYNRNIPSSQDSSSNASSRVRNNIRNPARNNIRNPARNHIRLSILRDPSTTDKKISCGQANKIREGGYSVILPLFSKRFQKIFYYWKA